MKHASLFAVVLVLMLSPNLLARAPAALGPHGGQIVGDDAHQIEVNVSRQKRSVDAYVLKEPGQPPAGLAIALTDRSHHTTTLELRPVPAASAALASTPAYHAQLDPRSQSYVGFELHIPLEGGAFKSLFGSVPEDR